MTVRVLSESDLESVLDLETLLSVVEDAFLAQGRGEVERPERPHFPVGEGIENGPLGTGLTMPAYVHGSPYFATKLVAVHEGNAARDLPTLHSQVALTDAADGRPVAYLSGNPVTNARTGCIGGLTVRELANAEEPIDLGIVGAGTQARWQTRAIAAATDVARVSIYSPSESREACAADLREEGIDAVAVDDVVGAVSNVDAVITTTTSTEPTFPGDALAPGTLVVAIGAYTPEMRELDEQTVERAARVFGDVPEEAVETGDLPGFDVGDVVPLSDVFEGRVGRESPEEILVVESVGSAVLDAAAAIHLYEQAVDAEVGSTVALV